MFTADMAREIVRNSYGFEKRKILEGQIVEICKKILEECKKENRLLTISDAYWDEVYDELASPPYNFRIKKTQTTDFLGTSKYVEISW